jgi:membrane protein YdbS with pleckstrin-like domain
VSLEVHLRIAGALLLLLAAAHPLFPKQLGWKEDLAKLTLLNRQIFLVHVGFIVLILVLFGTLALFFAGDLVAPSRLAAAVLAGLTVFWGLRLLTQQLVYDRSHWRGNRRNMVIHILATLLWTYLTAVFGWGWWRQLAGG